MIFLCPFQRQGRSDTFATEFDLEAEEYVPLPKGDVHKKKEIVQDVTLHDLDVANARPQVSAERDHYFQHDLYCTCIPDTSFIFLSVNAGPSEINKRDWMHYYSYNGDAHDTNVQNDIKENFFKLLKDPFFIPPPFCLVNNRCSKDKISISAGVVGT